ncbi:MAG: Lrp/AsnC family transcriptional regulator [Chloroflexaceae bacterium]|jgi:Lrp/AsnC family transcriptional regulator for asnA, asnC and gidA|nr:Lrp/AsnC family transcriptional regulator [Chloroflexaceae bacterium]
MSQPGELDALDRAILAQLQQDARLTNRAIAARVGSSEPTVRRRVERLVDEGLVRIVAVASPFALGHRLMAIIGLQIERAYQTQIEQALQAWPEVRFVGLTLGSYDIIIEVWHSDAEQLLEFLSNQVGRLPGVQRAETWQVVKLSKYSYDWGMQPSAQSQIRNTTP